MGIFVKYIKCKIKYKVLDLYSVFFMFGSFCEIFLGVFKVRFEDFFFVGIVLWLGVLDFVWVNSKMLCCGFVREIFS